MRVLIINSLYPPVGAGGAERSVAELAEKLVAHGISVAVVTLAPPEWSTDPDQPETRNGVFVHRWRTPGPWPFATSASKLGVVQRTVWHARESYRPAARRFVRRVVSKFSPDLIHTNNIAGFGVSILHEVRPRAWVHTYRDYYLICPRTTRFKAGRRCGGQCHDCGLLVNTRRLQKGMPDAVVGVSRSVLDIHHLAGVWRESPTWVVQNRPAVQFIEPRRVSEIRTVGFLGRVDEPKGAVVLLQAFSSCALEGIELVLAGPLDTGSAAASVAEADPSARVRWLGVVPAAEFFAQVDLVVVPSQWDEPFGRVAAEAAALGLPVIVSRRGGLPEAVAESERTMIVDQPERPEAWTEAILEASGRWSAFDVCAGVGANRQADEPYSAIYEAALRRAQDT